MTMCDELEAKLNQAQQQSEKLMDATVRKLLGNPALKKPHVARPAPAPQPLSPRARGEKAAPLPAGEGGRRPGEGGALPIAAEAPAAYSTCIPAAILGAMQAGGDYSRAELLAATLISETDWTWAIRQLKEQGQVVQTGEKRGARYRLQQTRRTS